MIVLLLVAGTAFLLNSRIGGIQVYDVYPTDSMKPTLEVGDLVIVEAVPYSTIHVGDVIVFAPPDSRGRVHQRDHSSQGGQHHQRGADNPGRQQVHEPTPRRAPLKLASGPARVREGVGRRRRSRSSGGSRRRSRRRSTTSWWPPSWC